MIRGRSAAPRFTPAIIAAVLLAAAPAAAQQLRFPSTCHDGCMTVTAYYDYGGVTDWNCGGNTYGGHRGTDFAIFGRFDAMDEGRDIVAAADGEVITAVDGNFDRCTTADCAGGGGFGNYVAVRHDDGKVAYYGHMRNGSVAVGVGARVTCGQHLGQVGSSGYSTGPHLHFEPRVGGTADDPFGMGGCSGPLVYWVDQGAYRALPAQTCESTAPPPPVAMDGAAVVSVEPAAGTHLVAGTAFTARIVMRNTGTTTWTDGEQHLLTHDGDERFSGAEQIHLDGASIAPGAEHTFTLSLTAPATAGDYVSYWRMDRYGTARFGDRAELRITADAPPAGAPDAGPGPDPTGDGGPGPDPTGDGGPGPGPTADAGPGGHRAPPGDRPTTSSLSGGCSTAGGSPAPLATLVALGALVVLRLRRKSSP